MSAPRSSRCLLAFVWALMLLASGAGAAPVIAHPSAMGWNLAQAPAGEWRLVAGNGRLEAAPPHGLHASLPAHATAVWVLTTEPIWVYRFGHVRLRYQARGLIQEDNLPLLRLLPGSTGPVTPGAANPENPFARRGEATLFPPPSLQSDGEMHEGVFPVHPPLRTEQIDQLVLSLQSGDAPGDLLIHDLSFFDPALAEDAKILETVPLSPIAAPLDSSSFLPLELPSSDCPMHAILDVDPALGRAVQCAEIPFLFSDPPTLLYTSLPDRDRLRLEVNRRGSEIFLLMGLYLVGDDGAFRFVPRSRIDQPERLIVRKIYEDGVEDQSFPYNLLTSSYVVEATLCAYRVPADPTRILKEIIMEERMPYGQVFLAGVTLNPRPESLKPTPPLRFPRPLSLPASATSEATRATLLVEKNRRFVLENRALRFELTTASGLLVPSIFSKILQKNLLAAPSPFFSLMVNGLKIPPDHLEVQTYKTAMNQLDFVLVPKEWSESIRLFLHVEMGTFDRVVCSLRVQNVGYTPASLRLRFPDLEGVRVSPRPEDDFYLFPRRRAAWDNAPTTLSGLYSGEFPLQFMDLYSESASVGLAVHTRDLLLQPKRYLLQKDETGSRLAVEYGYPDPIRLEANGVLQTPDTWVQVHEGDWHAPFRDYREWCRTWYAPDPKSRAILQDVFLCRRDYPIGGTGYLFDETAHAYTFDRLVAEGREDLGGVDMIDISGWAYSNDFGRVGNYERYELGGLKNLQQSIRQARSEQVKVGLYVEGYLVDPRSDLGTRLASFARLIDRDGLPKTWTGNEEMFFCPYEPHWRQSLSDTLFHVARDTGADALYLDQFGFANAAKICYSDAHGHAPGSSPMPGEDGMVESVRHALARLDRPVALYTEQVPCDVASRLIDAAFNYALAGTRDYQSPAKLSLFRFAFPSFKVIELFHPGIDPKGISDEDVKLCFFLGHALWLKGRARSWYSRECRDTIRKAVGLMHEYRDAFTSDDVEPMIPTLLPGVYANRFSRAGLHVITLYNASPDTARGILFAFPLAAVEAQDAWGMSRFQVEPVNDGVQIKGELHPHEVGCVVLRDTSPPAP